MGPVRTNSIPQRMPKQIMKTERTHEENQERAYIAASRRSDRSLEARVESARRASEIHKKRTGRSLRVTEKDVMNEEMYEEEDDLPRQYAGLTRHLGMGNTEMDRRLSAYLTSNVAMRAALEQTIKNSYTQQYAQQTGPAPAWPFQQDQMFPSPMIPQPNQQQLTQQPQQQKMQQPHSPSRYRQAPYPSPRPQQVGFQTAHQRSASMAVPPSATNFTQGSPAIGSIQGSPVIANYSRRMSAPVDPVASVSPTTTDAPSSAKSTTPHQRPSFPPGSFFTYGSFYQQEQPTQPIQPQDHPSTSSGTTASRSPMFTTALSAEAQMFLGPNFDINNTTMTMDGNQDPNAFKFWDFSSSTQTDYSKNMFGHPSLDGLTSTLAPAASDNYQPTMPEYNMKQFVPGNEFFSDGGTSGTMTPGNFDSFINWD